MKAKVKTIIENGRIKGFVGTVVNGAEILAESEVLSLRHLAEKRAKEMLDGMPPHTGTSHCGSGASDHGLHPDD